MATPEEKEIARLAEFPMSIRKYFTGVTETEERAERKMDTHLRRFDVTRYPINDRKYASPQAKVVNIVYNALNDKKVQELIDQYINENRWVYHPFRPYERYDTIAEHYYGDATKFWIIILFNRLTDPFKATEEFNIIRIPNYDIIPKIPRDFTFSYTYGKF